MSSKIGKIVNIILPIVMIMVFITVGSCFIFSNNEKTRISFGSSVTWNDGWTINGTDEVTLPYAFHGVKNETVMISNTLPDSIEDGDAIDISSNYCVNEIYIDGEERYSYGSKQVLPFGRMVGNVKCITRLNEEDAGKTVEIYITPLYTQNYQIPEVRFGDYKDICAHVLSDNLWKIIICTILGVFIVIAAAFGVSQHLNHIKHGRNMILHFSMFVMAACIWIICSSDIPQLFTNANEAVSLFSYLSLAFIGAPFMAFCAEIFPTGKMHFEVLSIVGCLITLFVAVAFMTGIADPPEILILSHIYFVFVVVADFFFSFRSKRNEKKTFLHKYMIVDNIILLLFVALGLLFYYIAPTSGMDSVFFSFGFTGFIALLFSMLVRMQLDATKEMAGMEVYKEMAYTDNMTKMGNRAAFDAEFDRLANGSYNEKERGVLFVLDLNNLKKVNDSIGHHAGDELIKGAAKCILTTFKDYGNSYRMGGDEFSIIVLEDIDCKEILARFDTCIDEYNEKHKYKISIARGYVVFEPNQLNLEKMREVFQQADDAMYQNKIEMKKVG